MTDAKPQGDNSALAETDIAPLELLWAQISAQLAQGATLGDLQGFSPEQYEAMYMVGHTLYQQARYDEAGQMFAHLVMNNPYDRRFPQALGSALQMQKKWGDAIAYYTVATLLDTRDPVPTYHTAECLLALGQTGDAADALGLVVKMSEKPEHAALKERAAAMLEIIEQTAKAPETP